MSTKSGSNSFQEPTELSQSRPISGGKTDQLGIDHQLATTAHPATTRAGTANAPTTATNRPYIQYPYADTHIQITLARPRSHEFGTESSEQSSGLLERWSFRGGSLCRLVSQPEHYASAASDTALQQRIRLAAVT